MRKRIGITTSLPIEVIYAAGNIPVDLNNLFVSHQKPDELLELAERDGFAPGVCAWIKGLYAVAIHDKLDQVVTVVHGDCANTVALGEVFKHRGVPVLEFAYPHHRDRELILMAIEDFRLRLGAKRNEVEQWKKRLDRIRQKLIRLDTLTWKTQQVTGYENHNFLVASSDFDGDPDGFEAKLDAFLIEASARPTPEDKLLRIGVIGVPTIFDDLYPYLDSKDTHVVFNEVQRQFSMPSLAGDLASQFESYTYPFDLRFRIADIKTEVKRRSIAGLVHYIQSFCHRQIEDIVIREEVGVPVLTIEGDRPGMIDGRTQTRIDAFLEMLRER